MILLSVTLVVPADALCQRAFGIDNCTGLKNAAEATPVPSQRGSQGTVRTPLMKPPRFVRQFHKNCRAVLGRDTSLSVCFRAQLVAIDQDADWKIFIAELPGCPATYETAQKVAQTAQNFTIPSTGATGRIEWNDAKRADYFVHRDHPDADYQMRGVVTSYIVTSNGSSRDLAQGRQWGLQCLYQKDPNNKGDGLPLLGPGAGSADRISPSHDLWAHMRLDVWWFHVALRLDNRDFNGPHVRAYQQRHPVNFP